MSDRRGPEAKFDVPAWQARARAELGEDPEPRVSGHGVRHRAVYHQGDVAGLAGLDSTPGFPPFTRGAYATMYRGRPWTLRQYAGFATVQDSNAFFKRALSRGQTGLSVAFDLPTHRGYDSDDPRIAPDVGKAGVAVDSIEDLALLFDGIDLERTSVSMTMNGAVLPILGGYAALALERGHRLDALRGTIQNDILKEFMVRNTYIYPPRASMRIVADIIEFCAGQMPRFNPVSISGYHMQEAGATLVQELAFSLGNGLEVVRAALAKGLSVDEFAPRLSFFFAVGMDFFGEIAKLRAARRLWAQLMTEHFGAVSAESLRLRMHCQTSGVSLTAQQPHNNLMRTTLEALAAVLGGTQSLHTNSYDEALALPSDEAAALARNTQLVIRHESGVADVVDPLGGSYYVEALTNEIAQSAGALIAEMEALGGMTEAISQGVPQAYIARSALERQLRLERGADTVVGVNAFAEEEASPEPALRFVHAPLVLAAQIERLQALRARRDETRVSAVLAALTEVARSDQGNLLAASIECMRARATVGEVSAALEEVWGRHVSDSSLISGAFTREYADDERWQRINRAVSEFERLRGRRPRLLVAKLGQDGHDRGAKVIASGFADAGFDVDLAPMFRTPEEVAKMAIDHDVHVVGISSQAGAHTELLPALMQALEKQGASDVLVVAGGVIPQADHAELLAHGVGDVFGPGTPVIEGIERVLGLLGVSATDPLPGGG